MVSLSQRNKWKYATIGLAAILALVLTTPQASAHVTTNLAHNVQHILDEIASLRSDVDSLAGDAATGADVEGLEGKIDDLAESNGGFQIIRESITTFDEGQDTATCASDSDYMLHVSAGGADSHNLRFFSGDTLIRSINISGTERYIEVGGSAGETLTVVVLEVQDMDGFANAVVTLETAEGATASAT